jgi:hypothetical protein
MSAVAISGSDLGVFFPSTVAFLGGTHLTLRAIGGGMMRLVRFLCATLVCMILSLPDATAAQICVGDCNKDSNVTVDEILTMVNIALGNKPLTACEAGNSNGDLEITIDEILIAVNHALRTCAESPLDEGLHATARGDLRSASAAFDRAVAASPGDHQARLFAAIAHAVVRVVDSPTASDLLGRAGGVIYGDSGAVCDLDASLPRPVSADAPSTEEFLTAIRTDLLPEVEAVLAELRDWPADIQIHFSVADLPECIRPDTDKTVVEVDRGDLLAMESGLELILFLSDLFDGYNTNVSLHTLVEDSVRTIVQSNPQLLTLTSADRLHSARDHFRTAMGKVVDAIDEIRAETDNQDDDLLVIDSDDVNDARKLRLILTLAEDALTQEVSLPIDVVTGEIDLMDIGLGQHERLNLDRFFSGSLASLRPLLPPFDANGDFDTSGYPDATFGGMAPDMTQSKLDHFLEGGPPCAVCTSDRDCDALGFGSFYCGYCAYFFSPCTGEQRRCSDGFTECSDGTFF